MKPWRDIFPADDFRALITEERKRSSSSRSTITLKGPRLHFLNKLANQIARYHLLPKCNRDMLVHRRSALLAISREANHWFTTYQASQLEAKERGDHGKFAEKISDYSLDRNMLTLMRVSVRKAAYLQKLKEYLEAPNRTSFFNLEYNSPDPADSLLVSMKNPQEAADFEHRDTSEDSFREVFRQWTVADDRHQFPFFLWMEDHPICTYTNRARISPYQSVTSIPYVNLEAGPPPAYTKMCRLNISPGRVFLEKLYEHNRRGGGYDVNSTSSYMADPEKKIDPAGTGQGVACYVWTPTDEVYIAKHEIGMVHHSSLFAGGHVKCAGMIHIHDSKVIGLSNNSGHYHPSEASLKRFITWLKTFSAIHPRANLKVYGRVDGGAFEGTLDHYSL